MATLVLTVIGDDRPGLVDALSGVVAEHGGNWEESRMAQLADKFAGILLVQVPDARAEDLTGALRALGSQMKLHIAAEPSAAATAGADQRVLELELLGQDHPGIVHDIAHALASRRISIQALHTETRSASMAGGTLFHARARLQVPASVDDDELRQALESLANELMVDIDLDATGD